MRAIQSLLELLDILSPGCREVRTSAATSTDQLCNCTDDFSGLEMLLLDDIVRHNADESDLFIHYCPQHPNATSDLRTKRPAG